MSILINDMKKSSRRSAKRQIRFLESEVKMLQHYLSECLEMLQEYDAEWRDDLAYFIKFFEVAEDLNDKEDTDKNIEIYHHNTAKDHEKQNTEKPEDYENIPSWAKKLYKKIAMITHPDRITDENRRQSLEKIFLRASESIECGNYEDLVSIALDFDLSSGLDDISLKPVLKNQISKIKEKIYNIESDIAWAWCESFGKHDIRCKLLKHKLDEKTVRLSDESIITAIKEREGETEEE